jgi:hypothetical protein
MLAETKITIGEISVRRELDVLGLLIEDLVNAILFGETHRGLCSEDDPKTFPGTTAWARTIRGLRENKRLWDLGWRKEWEDNFETIVSPDKTFAICVMTGDSATGKYDPDNPNAKPRPKNPKGIMLQRAIVVNTWLFPELAADADVRIERLQALNRRATWILLIHRDKGQDKDRVFAELSLPSEFDAHQVTNWGHRIVLDPLEVEPTPDVRDDSDDGSDEIFVAVEKIQ